MYSALIFVAPSGSWARRAGGRKAEMFVSSSLPPPPPPYMLLHSSLLLLRSPVGISRGGKRRIMSYLTGSSFVSYDKERG